MANRYPLLYRTIQIIAVIIALMGFLFPDLLFQWELILAVLFISLIGIPHGATDHLIFRNLAKPFLGARKMVYFYIYYLMLIGLYALLWWKLPIISFFLFLILSAYHFGQSNWNFVPFNSKILGSIYYFLWGAYVIVSPVVFNYDNTQPIIQDIVRQSPPDIALGWRWGMVIGLFAANLLLAFGLVLSKRLGVRAFLEEVLNLVILGAVFYMTPVLLGFAVYFVLWHSLSSVMDQVKFFQERKAVYSIGKYVKDTLPFTLLALVGMAAMFWMQFEFMGTIEIGLLFVFISIVTLPHMILIDQLYNDGHEKMYIHK